MLIVIAGLSALVFFLAFKVLSIVFKVQSKKGTKLLSSLNKEKETYDYSPFYILSSFVKIPNYKREEMEKKLDILNVKMTPEDYVSSFLVKTIIFMFFGIILILLGQLKPTLLIIAGGILVFVKQKNKIKDTFKYRRELIESEAPFLIRYFDTSLKSESNIIEIFKKYEKLSKFMKPEISRLILNMQVIQANEDSIISSLEDFSDRQDTPIITDFCNALIRKAKGEDQEKLFQNLEKECQELSFKNLMKKANSASTKLTAGMFIYLIAWLICLFAFIGIMVANMKFFG